MTAAITDKQSAFLIKLINERFAEGTHDHGQWHHWIKVGTVTKSNFGKFLDKVKETPVRVDLRPAFSGRPSIREQIATVAATIPVSDTQDTTYFAFDGEESDGEVKFYVLTRPTSGTWAGRVFLAAMGSDNEYPIKNDVNKLAIITKLSDDYVGAVTRFGHAFERCGVCNRGLTDTDSRARGIGPDCAKKVGI